MNKSFQQYFYIPIFVKEAIWLLICFVVWYSSRKHLNLPLGTSYSLHTSIPKMSLIFREILRWISNENLLSAQVILSACCLEIFNQRIVCGHYVCTIHRSKNQFVHLRMKQVPALFRSSIRCGIWQNTACIRGIPLLSLRNDTLDSYTLDKLLQISKRTWNRWSVLIM